MKKASSVSTTSSRQTSRPRLDARHRRMEEALKRMPDSEINYSDIPRLTRSDFRKAVQTAVANPAKQQLTVRLDADVFAWLKSLGKGYQTKLNAILKAAMKASN